MQTYTCPIPKFPKVLPSHASFLSESPVGLLLLARQAWSFGAEDPSLSTLPPSAAFPGAKMSLGQREGRLHLQLPCYHGSTSIYCAPLGPSRGPDFRLEAPYPTPETYYRWSQDLSPQQPCFRALFSWPGEGIVNKKQCPIPSEK